jgi:hypothetical protein
MRWPAVLPALPAAAVLILVLLAAALLAGCGSAALNAYDVGLQAASVQSTAAEAAFLARGAAQGHDTEPFVRTHASELAQSAGAAARELDAAQAASGLRGRVRALARVSAATAAQLTRLAAAADDRALAAAVAARCAVLAGRAKELTP